MNKIHRPNEDNKKLLTKVYEESEKRFSSGSLSYENKETKQNEINERNLK